MLDNLLSNIYYPITTLVLFLILLLTSKEAKKGMKVFTLGMFFAILGDIGMAMEITIVGMAFFFAMQITYMIYFVKYENATHEIRNNLSTAILIIGFALIISYFMMHIKGIERVVILFYLVLLSINTTLCFNKRMMSDFFFGMFLFYISDAIIFTDMYCYTVEEAKLLNSFMYLTAQLILTLGVIFSKKN